MLGLMGVVEVVVGLGEAVDVTKVLGCESCSVEVHVRALVD